MPLPEHSRASSCVTVFPYLSSILYLNDFELECFSTPREQKNDYFHFLYSVFALEAIEPKDTGPFSGVQLPSMFIMFPENMRKELKSLRRRSSQYALHLWKYMNSKVRFTSALAFNKVTKAAVSSQASSPGSRSIFSNLGRLEEH